MVPDTIPTETDPIWAEGKSRQEVVKIAKQLEQVVKHYVQTGIPQPSLQSPPPSAAMPDDEYVRGADLNRLAPKMVQDAVAPQFQQIFESQAALALEQVKREYPSEFAKYGPTIYGNLSGVDKRTWTVDNLRKVVKYSLADHLDDIVRDKLRDAPAMEPALRSTGAAPVPVTPAPADDLSLRSEKLPAEYRARLEKAGVTDSTLDEFLRANGMTRSQFFKQFENKPIITEGPRR